VGLFTIKCTSCGDRIRRGSKFCPHCGAAAPNTTKPCPGCGNPVKAGSKFCPACGRSTAKASPVAGSSETTRHWTRPPGDFAVRIDTNLAEWRGKHLVVEHGTRALIFQEGVFKGEVGEGRYSGDDLPGRLKPLSSQGPIVAVVVDAGDVPIDLENDGLRSSDGFELGMRSRLVLRIKDPEALYVNLMKGRPVLRISDPDGKDDVEGQLADEMQVALRSLAATYTADALFGQLAVRGELETRLRDALSTSLGRLGLELVQIRFLDFEGQRYAELRQKRAEVGIGAIEGQIEIDRARQDQAFAKTRAQDEVAAMEAGVGVTADRARLNKRLREVLTQDKIDTFRSAAEFEAFVRQTEHELGLKAVIRGDEMERLRERFEFERNREGLLRRIEIAGIVGDHVRAEAWTALQAEERERDERQTRDLRRQLELATSDVDARRIRLEIERLDHAERLRQAEAELVFGGIEHREQMRRAAAEEDLRQKKTAAGLDQLRQVKQMEAEEDRLAQELEHRRLTSRSQASIAALLSMADADSKEKLLELERLRIQEKMTPEQMLAEAARTNPEAARALAQKFQAEGLITAKAAAERIQLLEKQIAEQRQMTDGYADRMERIMGKALDQMGQVATTRARPIETSQTVVTPGSPGARTVVINPPGAATAVCAACGTTIEAGVAFCPECGVKQ